MNFFNINLASWGALVDWVNSEYYRNTVKVLLVHESCFFSLEYVIIQFISTVQQTMTLDTKDLDLMSLSVTKQIYKVIAKE